MKCTIFITNEILQTILNRLQFYWILTILYISTLDFSLSLCLSSCLLRFHSRYRITFAHFSTPSANPFAPFAEANKKLCPASAFAVHAAVVAFQKARTFNSHRHESNDTVSKKIALKQLHIYLTTEI